MNFLEKRVDKFKVNRSERRFDGSRAGSLPFSFWKNLHQIRSCLRLSHKKSEDFYLDWWLALYLTDRSASQSNDTLLHQGYKSWQLDSHSQQIVFLLHGDYFVLFMFFVQWWIPHRPFLGPLKWIDSIAFFFAVILFFYHFF